MVVGVVQNSAGEVLISFRDPSLHQGGLWEFPGGKVDSGEGVQAALCREFQEELGITPTEYFPFKKIRFEYSDREVLLDVWRVTQFTGTPIGREGQAVQWKAAKALSFKEFPAANKDIVRLLQLPKEIPITPQAESLSELLEMLASWADQKFQMVYFRQPQLNPDGFSQWYRAATELCSDRGLAVFANMDSAQDSGLEASGGAHAGASRLMALTQRPCGDERYFSASCHSLAQLNKAQELGADFVFLSPVRPVERYGGASSLGWEGFRELAGSVSLPVYALGGLGRNDIVQAMANGAVGIAGISAYL